MSFRNRPVLDRKHRPRWQDELRSQQLIVGGFALAIAVAIGIFAAASWASFYNANLRQVAVIDGQSIQRSDITHRADLIAAQLTATYIDLAGQLGGARDQLLQQQISAIQQALESVNQVASDSIVTGRLLDAKSAEFGLSVPQDELDAEVTDRRTLPERRQLSVIVVKPEKDDGAPADAVPTDQDWADAKSEIDAVKAELDDGGDFSALATEHSDDATKATGGLIGWVSADDTTYEEYHDAVAEAEVGDVIGPTRSDDGWYLVRLDDLAEEHADEELANFLDAAGISDAEYRDYVRLDLLQGKFRDYFTNTVLGRYQPQRHVAQIFISADSEAGVAAPKIHVRHLLAQPIPGAEDQSTATDEQWAAALERAEELRVAAMEPDADWYELGAQSDDTGSASRGGYLGWYDPAALATQFVPEFAAAAGQLDVGEVSEPVRSDFGYHIIQVTDRRASALEQANRIVDQTRRDPDSFGQVAHEQSEDPTTAQKDGEVGWVTRYQYEAERQDAIFGLAEPGQISDPLVTDNGIYIFKLLDTAEARYTPQGKRDQVASSGFNRWLVELKDSADIWIDPEFAPTTTTAA
jgi:peptidyl-prolyl cis-trans isomerase SurA